MSRKNGSTLTAREEEILWLVAAGLSNKLIAAQVGISEHTAKFHVHNAVAKMGTRCRTRAAVDFVLARADVAKERLNPAQQSLKLVA